MLCVDILCCSTWEHIFPHCESSDQWSASPHLWGSPKSFGVQGLWRHGYPEHRGSGQGSALRFPCMVLSDHSNSSVSWERESQETLSPLLCVLFLLYKCWKLTKKILEKEAEHNDKREKGESKKGVRNTLPSQRVRTAQTLLELITQGGRQAQYGFLPGNLLHTGGTMYGYFGNHCSEALACGWAWTVLCLPHPSWFLQMLETAVCEPWCACQSTFWAPEFWGVSAVTPAKLTNLTYILRSCVWKCRGVVEASFLHLHRRASENSGLAKVSSS